MEFGRFLVLLCRYDGDYMGVCVVVVIVKVYMVLLHIYY